MNDRLVSGLVEGVKVLASVQNERARYEYLTNTSALNRANRTPLPAVSAEVTLPGVKLNNYTNRVQLEGDNSAHVKVVVHKEYLEKVPVPVPPPSPEEIARKQDEKRFMAKLWAGVATVGIVVVGTVVIVERTQNRKSLVIEN